MKKDWKAITLDWTALSNYDDEEIISICLTQRQVAILKGLLSTAYWLTRWTNLSVGKDVVESTVSEIDYRLDGNDCEAEMLDFRDNPLDTCEVQYSKDGGETWITMFRKDICPPKSLLGEDNITQIYNDIDYININNETWDGDIINVAPQWEYAAFTDRALCYAIHVFVDTVCETAIAEIKKGNAERREQNEFLDVFKDALTVGLVAVIGLLPAAPVTLPAAAITACAWAAVHIVDAVWDYIVTKDFSDFEDEDARQVVKCQMYFNIMGGTPQWEDWESSMDMWSNFCGNEATIAGLVYKFVKDVDLYVNYLILMEDINSIAESLPICPCPERWEHFWDFENVGAGTWKVYGEYGHYVDGVGFVPDLRLLGDDYSNMITELALGAEIKGYVQRCDGFEIHTTVVRGHFANDVDWLAMSQEPHAIFRQSQGHCLTGNPGWRHNFPLGTLTKVEVDFIRSCFTQGDDYGEVTITGITLHGQGVDPFSGCDS